MLRQQGAQRHACVSIHVWKLMKARPIPSSAGNFWCTCSVIYDKCVQYTEAGGVPQNYINATGRLEDEKCVD